MIQNHPNFIQACKKVAEDWRTNARAIKLENAYASHVTEETKVNNLNEGLALADKIEQGEVKTFTIWQRVNFELTGECVPLLS